MTLLKISEATLYRWVSESRRGAGTFPLPISQFGRTLRWNSDEIDAWCRSGTPANLPPARPAKTTVKELRHRVEAMLEALQRHGLCDKTK